MGHCEYLLAEDAVAKSFSVMVDNFPCGTDNSQSCTKTVTAYFNTTSVHLKRGSSVSANGQDLSMFPYKHNGKADFFNSNRKLHHSLFMIIMYVCWYNMAGRTTLVKT
jgi:hypothetical protein